MSDLSPGFEPFDPRGHAPEPELQAATPRPIPDLLRRGHHETKRRKAERAALLSGFLLIGISNIPFLHRLGLYFLPLQYLHWIGLGLIVLALIGAIRRVRGWGRPYVYVKRGLSLPVRVLQVVKAPTKEGYVFFARIEFTHPANGRPAQAAVCSETFSTDQRRRYSTPLQAGQYVTALYLPGRLEKTLTLYGFLRLHPQVDFLHKSGKPDRFSNHPLVIALGICLLLTLLIGMAYAGLVFFPTDLGHPDLIIYTALGGLVFGTLALWWFIRVAKQGDPGIKAMNEMAAARGEAMEVEEPPLWNDPRPTAWAVKIIMVPGCYLITSLVVMCGLFAVNALGGSQQVERKEVAIESFIMTTNNLLVRTYSIKYHDPATGRLREFCTTPDWIARFRSDHGILEIHYGLLGWAWIKQMHPLTDSEDSEPAIEVPRGENPDQVS